MTAGVGLDPLVGRAFRGYRIERLLASGGMGAVYLARDETLPNVCKVIKILRMDPDLDPSMRGFVQERFVREALAVSVLRHENIVRVHGVGTLDGDGTPCMLMDYVEGQTLHEFMRSHHGPVPLYRAFPRLCHVARGLDAAHALGIVHRDLKPANIMLCPRDNDPAFAVLLDFGTAKITRPIVGGLVPTMGGMGIGTPSYMAVEQFRHADEATPLSDVYALAIIIWELVTGDLPWGRHDITTPLGISMLYELQRERQPNPPPPDTLPPVCERALRSALSPNPDERPPSVRHLMVELAVGLPSVGRHVLSGVEMLRAIAPRFIAEAGPDAETLRNEPHRTIVVAWPRSEALHVATADIPTQRAGAQPGRRAPGHAAQPPTPMLASVPTTLGASNGVLVSRPRSRSGWQLGLVAVTAASLTTVGLYAVFNGRDKAAASEPAPPGSAAPSPATMPPPATTSTTPSPTAPPNAGPSGPPVTTTTASVPTSATIKSADSASTANVQVPPVREPRPSPHPADAPKPAAIQPSGGTQGSRPSLLPQERKRNQPATSPPTIGTKPNAETPVPKRKFDPDAAGGTVEK